MYAIIESGGKQYKVTPGETILLEKLPGEAGTPVELTRVLLVAANRAVKVGTPTVPGAKVLGEIVAQERGPKLLVFKYKRRKNYRRRRGHRQALTRVRIKEILIPEV